MYKNRDEDWALILILVEIIIVYWRRAFKWVIWNGRLVKIPLVNHEINWIAPVGWYSQFLWFWCDYSSSVIKTALLWFLIIHRSIMLFSIKSKLVWVLRKAERKQNMTDAILRCATSVVNKKKQMFNKSSNISRKETEISVVIRAKRPYITLTF